MGSHVSGMLFICFVWRRHGPDDGRKKGRHASGAMRDELKTLVKFHDLAGSL
jgi:hypothetical protein